jgi:hypothetical protein
MTSVTHRISNSPTLFILKVGDHGTLRCTRMSLFRVRAQRPELLVCNRTQEILAGRTTENSTCSVSKPDQRTFLVYFLPRRIRIILGHALSERTSPRTLRLKAKQSSSLFLLQLSIFCANLRTVRGHLVSAMAQGWPRRRVALQLYRDSSNSP